MKKVIVGLIVFLAAVLVSIIGVLGYTKIFANPKNVFKKQFGEAISTSLNYKPAKLKGVYEAMETDPVEFSVNAELSMDEEEGDSEVEGSTNYHETSITLSMNDDEEEQDDEESSEENTDEDEEDSRSQTNSRATQEDDDEEESPLSEEDEFLSNYTWSSASGTNTTQSAYDDDLDDGPHSGSVKYITTIDKSNHAANASVEITSETEDKEYMLLKGDVNYSNKTLSAYVEGLHDKNIAVRNENLRDMFENLGVSEDTLKYIPDSIELFEMSSDEIDELKTKVYEFMVSTLDEYDESTYTVSKFSEQYGKYMTDTYTGKKATLKVPAKGLKTKVCAFIKEIYTDETTLPSLKNTLTNDAKKEILSRIDKWQKSIDKSDDNQMMEISVYASKDGAYKVAIKVDGENPIEYYEAIDPNKDKVEAMQNSTLVKDEDTMEIITPGSISYTYFDLGNENIYQIESTHNEVDLEQMLDEYNSSINTVYEEDEEDEEDDDDESYEYYDSYGTKRKIDYYKDLYPDKLMTIEFTFDDQDQSLLAGSMKMSLVENGKKASTYNSLKSTKFTVKKSDGKSIKKVSDDNGLIINTYSKDDFDDMKVEMLANIEKYAQENPMSWASTVSSYMSLLRMYSSNDTSGYSVEEDDSDDDYSVMYNLEEDDEESEENTESQEMDEDEDENNEDEE